VSRLSIYTLAVVVLLCAIAILCFPVGRGRLWTMQTLSTDFDAERALALLTFVMATLSLAFRLPPLCPVFQVVPLSERPAQFAPLRFNCTLLC